MLALYRPVNSPLMAHLNCITAMGSPGFWFFWEYWYNANCIWLPQSFGRKVLVQ